MNNRIDDIKGELSKNGDEEPETGDATGGGSTDGTTTQDADSGGEAADPTTTPAFDYSEEIHRATYAREEHWTAWEDAQQFEIDRVLRDYGVRDAAGREYHEAVYRLATLAPEAVAALMLDARGIDHDLDVELTADDLAPLTGSDADDE